MRKILMRVRKNLTGDRAHYIKDEKGFQPERSKGIRFSKRYRSGAGIFIRTQHGDGHHPPRGPLPPIRKKPAFFAGRALSGTENVSGKDSRRKGILLIGLAEIEHIFSLIPFHGKRFPSCVFLLEGPDAFRIHLITATADAGPHPCQKVLPLGPIFLFEGGNRFRKNPSRSPLPPGMDHPRNMVSWIVEDDRQAIRRQDCYGPVHQMSQHRIGFHGRQRFRRLRRVLHNMNAITVSLLNHERLIRTNIQRPKEQTLMFGRYSAILISTKIQRPFLTFGGFKISRTCRVDQSRLAVQTIENDRLYGKWHTKIYFSQKI